MGPQIKSLLPPKNGRSYQTMTRGTRDPNDKVGPDGFGQAEYYPGKEDPQSLE
jgi:hypothetical protein